MNPHQPSFIAGEYYPPSLMLTAYAFVDGAYFRCQAKRVQGVDYPNPHSTIEYVMRAVREMGGYSPTTNSVFARRMFYYDATDLKTGAPDPNNELYWAAVEHLPDTEVRFGALRAGA